MQIHQLKIKNTSKHKKRVGRGGKKGTYCGRGMKGQKSRAGRKMQPIIRELIKKYPKLRGYRFKPLSQGLRLINLSILDDNFKENEIVSPEILVENKLIRRFKGKIPEVKILANGNLTKKIIFKGCVFSEKALEKAKELKCEIK